MTIENKVPGTLYFRQSEKYPDIINIGKWTDQIIHGRQVNKTICHMACHQSNHGSVDEALKYAKLFAASERMLEALKRLSCIADTAAHYMHDTPESALFKKDKVIIDELLAEIES